MNVKDLGIYGNYSVNRIYETTDRFPGAAIKEDFRLGKYFTSDSQVYEYFRENYPEYEVSMTSCKSKPPYEYKEYTRWHVAYVKVTLESPREYGIVVLMKR